MTVFSSNFSAFKTKPESRCGRRPTVVRITRSHDSRGAARLTGGCAWLAPDTAPVAGTGGWMVAVVFRTAHPEARPAAAVTPVNWRKSRRLITILGSAHRPQKGECRSSHKAVPGPSKLPGCSTVTNRGLFRERTCPKELH